MMEWLSNKVDEYELYENTYLKERGLKEKV